MSHTYISYVTYGWLMTALCLKFAQQVRESFTTQIIMTVWTGHRSYMHAAYAWIMSHMN